jgi:hypothetical protein
MANVLAENNYQLHITNETDLKGLPDGKMCKFGKIKELKRH